MQYIELKGKSICDTRETPDVKGSWAESSPRPGVCKLLHTVHVQCIEDGKQKSSNAFMTLYIGSQHMKELHLAHE